MQGCRTPTASRIASRIAIGLVLSALATLTGRAADDKAPTPAEPPAYVETRHTITLGGRPLNYRAVAETIGLTDPKAAPTRSVYTIAQLAGSAPGPPGPVG